MISQPMLFLKERTIVQTIREVFALKQHRFWAWGAVICMIMVMITGYKRK